MWWRWRRLNMPRYDGPRNEPTLISARARRRKQATMTTKATAAQEARAARATFLAGKPRRNLYRLAERAGTPSRLRGHATK